MKHFGTCPCCKGSGHVKTVCFGAFCGLRRCELCEGFGLLSVAFIATYADFYKAAK